MPLNLFQNTLPVGTEAPDFDCLDEAGNRVHLAGLRGTPVVLVFYPGDDTPGCRKQLCEFRDSWATLRTRNVAVFGVNPQSAKSHRKFVEKYQFPFPILVDAGQRIARDYNAAGWMVRRTVVLIDAQGVIRFSQRGMPSPQIVMEVLEASESTGPQ